MGNNCQLSGEELITRKELAVLAQAEGLDLSVRTLRYWAQKGLIPRPTLIEGAGNVAFYPVALLERLRILAALRPARIQALKSKLLAEETLDFGDKRFVVTPPLAQWQRNGSEYEIRFLANGAGMLLIQRKISQESKPI